MIKSKYYVMVADGSKFKFVTGLAEKRTAIWEDGKEALPMAKTVADNICEGLFLNGFPAMTVRAFDSISIKNPEKENREEKLLQATVNWFVNDCCELEYAKDELQEIGFSDDELEKYGFPECAE